jgi:hypothetical protein
MRKTSLSNPKKLNHSNKLYNLLKIELIILKRILTKILLIYRKDSKKKRLSVDL